MADLYVIMGEPDYDDSSWIDSIHSTPEAAAARINEDRTPTGRWRRGLKALFPHGFSVLGFDKQPDGSWREQDDEPYDVAPNFRVWHSPAEEEVMRIIRG